MLPNFVLKFLVLASHWLTDLVTEEHFLGGIFCCPVNQCRLQHSILKTHIRQHSIPISRTPKLIYRVSIFRYCLDCQCCCPPLRSKAALPSCRDLIAAAPSDSAFFHSSQNLKLPWVRLFDTLNLQRPKHRVVKIFCRALSVLCRDNRQWRLPSGPIIVQMD
ncbi:hypothetical protein B0T20DRAFT_399700 [Sordaria brevicollis]|uniref:C2H2-type domain-containing protein n=1 Tax=Sordaria brevicollis TaxID=83679 RepID=A0AAE0UGZ1_SORBR|nr:hypothetical protein B0T20DRAFT_399700 [Sordaria brevicollis]